MSRIEFLKESFLAYHTVPNTLISSVAGWSATYFFIKRITSQDPEWTVRVVTVLHAIIITILAVADWTWFRQWNIEQLGEANSKYEEGILCLTLGYFLFDLFWIIRYKSQGFAMYFHHGIGIVCLILVIAKGTSACEALVGTSGLEVTNPCLQARWFLRTYGYQGRWIYFVTEAVFMVTFIALRIFYGTYFTYKILLHPQCHLTLKMGTLGLYCVSWNFTCQMFSCMNKKIKSLQSENLKLANRKSKNLERPNSSITFTVFCT